METKEKPKALEPHRALGPLSEKNLRRPTSHHVSLPCSLVGPLAGELSIGCASFLLLVESIGLTLICSIFTGRS